MTGGPPRTEEAVRLVLVMTDLQRAHARLEALGRCEAARELILQAAESVRVAYGVEQEGGAS